MSISSQDALLILAALVHGKSREDLRFILEPKCNIGISGSRLCVEHPGGQMFAVSASHVVDRLYLYITSNTLETQSEDVKRYIASIWDALVRISRLPSIDSDVSAYDDAADSLSSIVYKRCMDRVLDFISDIPKSCLPFAILLEVGIKPSHVRACATASRVIYTQYATSSYTLVVSKYDKALEMYNTSDKGTLHRSAYFDLRAHITKFMDIERSIDSLLQLALSHRSRASTIFTKKLIIEVITPRPGVPLTCHPPETVFAFLRDAAPSPLDAPTPYAATLFRAYNFSVDKDMKRCTRQTECHVLPWRFQFSGESGNDSSMGGGIGLEEAMLRNVRAAVSCALDLPQDTSKDILGQLENVCCSISPVVEPAAKVSN
ncbi:hypothetical protein BDZ89DRAFT_1073815 [Hymenopellis radicata]|nr:hypothetical protein BDZ89DRAFT_1073815 [Hymenopellis radicata]